MIKSPIQKVTDKFQYRAIGIIYGSYDPLNNQTLNKGKIKDLNGMKLDAVVLGKALPLIKKHIDFKKKYYWIVYPRNKNVENLHLQIAGIWDPYNLNDSIEDTSKQLKEILSSFDLMDNFFSIRGKLIFVNSSEKEIVVKILPSASSKNNKNKSFKIVLKGEISMEFLNSFISLDVNRIGNILQIDNFEVIQSSTSLNKSSP